MPAKEKYFVESFGRGEAGRVLTDLVPLSYGSEVCAPGHAASGLRDYYMIHYVVSGRGRFDYRGETYAPGAGQIFIVSPGEWHRYVADEREPWHYVWICFRGTRAADLATRPPVQRYTGDAFRRLLRCGEYGSAAAEYAVSCLFEVLSFILRETRAGGAEGEGDGYAERARRMVDTLYMMPITVGGIAAQLSIDRRYLPRLFRARYGITLREYLTRVRMENAARLLREGYNAEEAGRLSGYDDPVNFYRMFKRSFGEGAAAYRRRIAAAAGDTGEKSKFYKQENKS
ncbi:MAG: AraC family ligand binding domain-containing protein [Clostridia bacterium]|nr:AraC family ligand binding domain-containing protein [Clostridia bacterium]